MSNFNPLQPPLLHQRRLSISVPCSSDISLTHEPLLATAAASLRSSIAQSHNDASNASRFLTDAINKLAVAYEQASVCALAGHSLRQKSPCVRPDDIMRCCGIASACSSGDSNDDSCPYPAVWGSDFEVSCAPGPVKRLRSCGGAQSEDTLSASLKRAAQSLEECSSQPQLLDGQNKRVRAMGGTEGSSATVQRGPAHEAVSSAVGEGIAGFYLRDTSLPLQAAAACAKAVFDWLPGDGVIP